ncbi:MAG: sigma-70 family RNA polymerase sigma factor, partial [Clostridiales Family XIII bacterium]|nr:sigma-70 family RNA polymerase sigma factor [Clostridiales Family XIII bacterium]
SARLKKRSISGDFVDIDEYESNLEDNDREFLPEAYLENEEFKNRLYEVITKLPTKKRDAIIMYYYENLSYKEIAGIMDSSIKTVASNITRARAIIKDRLGQRDYVPGRLTASGSALVISRVLEDQAIHVIPDQLIAAFQMKWASALSPIKFPAAQVAVTAKNVAVVATCSTLAVGGAVAIPAYVDNTSHVREAPAVVDVRPDGEIRFAGSDASSEHVNPTSAVVTIEGIGSIEIGPTWKVTDKATGTVIATGDGYEVSGVFDKLQKKNKTGKYVLTFTAEDENGVSVTARRDFMISEPPEPETEVAASD